MFLMTVEDFFRFFQVSLVIRQKFVLDCPRNQKSCQVKGITIRLFIFNGHKILAAVNTFLKSNQVGRSFHLREYKEPLSKNYKKKNILVHLELSKLTKWLQNCRCLYMPSDKHFIFNERAVALAQKSEVAQALKQQAFCSSPQRRHLL